MGKGRSKKQEKKGKGGVRNLSKPLVSHVIAFVAGYIICGGSFFLLGSGVSHETELGPKNIDQLLNMSETELAKLDIGLVSLLCAEGLDGSEDLDIDKCLATLDKWAEFIRKDT